MKDLLDFLINCLTNDLFEDVKVLLGTSPATQYSDAWDKLVGGTDSIFKTILFPIGIGICTIYFLISLMDKVTTEQLNLEQFIKQFMKLIIVVYISQYAITIITDLMGFSQSLFKEVFGEISVNPASSAESFYKSLPGYTGGFGAQLGLAGQLILPAFFTLIMRLVINFVCYSRLIEIYIKAMFTPIAVSDIFVGGMNSNGVRYLKGFLALCMQSVIIIVTNYIYSVINGAVVSNIDPGLENLFPYLVATLGINLAATGLLVKSLQITKDIVGA